MDTTETPPASPSQRGDSNKKVRIYTMPEKFYVQDKGGSSSKNSKLVIIIIILVIILLGGGGFILYQKYAGSVTGNQTNDTNESLANATNSNTNGDGNLNFVTPNSNVTTLPGSNGNLNTNTGLQNVNLFPTLNTNTNVITNVNAVPSSADADADGLTDDEETLYATGISVPDTDSDGYTDGQEVTSGYNPKGSGKLEGAGSARRYDDTQNGFSILYPSTWVVANDPQNSTGKIFTTNGEFISVSVQDNPARLSARDWYLTKSPGIDSSQIQSVTTWDKSMTGVKSLDGMATYFSKGNYVYVVSYNTNILSEARFKSTFTMMYSSLTTLGSLTPVNSNTATTTNANSNANANTNSSQNTNSASNVNTNVNTNTQANSNSSSY